MTNDEKIRVQILEAMARKGLRQAPLARQLGITPQSLNQVIKGDRAVLPTSLTAVLDALELELTVKNKNAEAGTVNDPTLEPVDAETRAWADAELAPPLEPYEWGDVDPETLGRGQVRYVAGEGWVVEQAG